MKSELLFYTLLLICSVQSARILVVFPQPGRSHYILGSSLARALAERGHDVTMISSFGEKKPPKNGTYTDIVITGFAEEMQEIAHTSGNMFDHVGSNPFMSAGFITYMFTQLAEKPLQHDNFQKLLSSKQNFDVVIVEQFMNDAYKALSTHFDAPLIVFSSIGPNFWVNDIIGNPSPLSYVPTLMSDYTPDMTFCERVGNTLFHLGYVLLYNGFVYPSQNAHIKKNFPQGPDINDVLYNASLVLLNSHPSINQAVPKVPSMIEIGGYHIKPPKKLPQDLQQFLDGAKDGVIYFSMGSNLKSSQLPAEKRDAFLKTFARLKEKILWKWEDDVLPGQPPNVKLEKWLPQQDILAHPNVKLFITHGGLLSTTETIYHGVPILAIPIFGDQQMNAKTAVNGGYGLMIDYSEISEEKLTKNIEELLTNPKYRENAKTRSILFHDRPEKPLDTAMYWVEYVIRHKGAPHLRVAALDLPWYKYHLLDVIAFLTAVTLTATFVFCFIAKRIFRKLFVKKIKTH